MSNGVCKWCLMQNIDVSDDLKKGEATGDSISGLSGLTIETSDWTNGLKQLERAGMESVLYCLSYVVVVRMVGMQDVEVVESKNSMVIEISHFAKVLTKWLTLISL